MTPEELCRAIADEDPIMALDYHNECRYCRTPWAESNYKLWLMREREGPWNDHHDSDCIWIRANQALGTIIAA